MLLYNIIYAVSYDVCWCTGKAEDSAQAKAKPNVQIQTKDDAYDTFMKEMAGLL